MQSDLKQQMEEDLGRMMDRLCLMKLQPALYLSQKFDSIINAIDLDAERILMELVENSTMIGSEPEAASKMNEARCEFVRILKLLEQSLQTRLAIGGKRELVGRFRDLQERVQKFQSTPFSSGDDINELEDSYTQLVLELTEMTNTEQSNIMGNQTVFYLSSNEPRILGSLFHLTGVYLTTEEIDCLK